jgi:hypothetical protein
MTITGYKARNVFDRYNTVSPGDLEEAARRVDERIVARTTTLLTALPPIPEGYPLLGH